MNSRRNKPYSRQLKGIDAYIGETAPTPNNALIPIEKIQFPSQQPRRYFDPDQLKQLTQSVKEHGILEPLLVRPLADNRYELVAGERRYRAATAASLTEVPVVVKELTDDQALQLSLVENLQREDLNPVEETEGILQLLALQLDSTPEEARQLLYQMKNAIEKRKKEESDSRDNVIPNLNSEREKNIQSGFERLGKNWYSFTCNHLPLLNLPEDILEALRQGKIEYTKAKALARVKDEQRRKQLLEKVLAYSLSLNQIRELIKEAQASKQQSELRTRFDATYKRAKQAKSLWSNAKKKKQLESLLARLEKLIDEEEK